MAAFPMPPAPRLNAEFYWECPTCRRSFARLETAALCHRTPEGDLPTVAAPLVRCLDLAMFDGHPLALTGWLEADPAELTVLRGPEDEGALKATAYRFCAPRAGLGSSFSNRAVVLGGLSIMGGYGGAVRTVAGTIFVALINFLVTIVQAIHASRLRFSRGIILFTVCVSRQRQKRPAMRT
jgi:hypothetical protein